MKVTVSAEGGTMKVTVDGVDFTYFPHPNDTAHEVAKGLARLLRSQGVSAAVGDKRRKTTRGTVFVK